MTTGSNSWRHGGVTTPTRSLPGARQWTWGWCPTIETQIQPRSQQEAPMLALIFSFVWNVLQAVLGLVLGILHLAV